MNARRSPQIRRVPMENKINVREILGVKENNPLFIRAAGPDKHAAAERLASTEKHFEEWHSEINRTNTRGLPPELIALYDEATEALCKILTYEKWLILWR